MKTKKNRSFYIERAKKDFKTLVIYFNVTRPQHEPTFRNPETNKFDLDIFIDMLGFLRKWKKQPSDFKKQYAYQYRVVQMKMNYTFGIPSELIEKVLGCYRDENDKKTRISIDEVVTPLINEGFIKKINAGVKRDFKTGEKKFWWYSKYMLANREYWMRLMKDPRFGKLETYPHASDRVKKIIFEWKESIGATTNNIEKDGELNG